MAFSLPLPPAFRKLWKLKIRDKERLEPPHSTLLRGSRAYRWDLRRQHFMDELPDPAEVPNELILFLTESHATLVQAWDERYPWNPVSGAELE